MQEGETKKSTRRPKDISFLFQSWPPVLHSSLVPLPFGVFLAEDLSFWRSTKAGSGSCPTNRDDRGRGGNP